MGKDGKGSGSPLWAGLNLPVDFSPSAHQGPQYPQLYPGGRCTWWPSASGFPWVPNSSCFLRIASLHSDLCSDRSAGTTSAPSSLPHTLYLSAFLVWSPSPHQCQFYKNRGFVLCIVMLLVPRTVPAYSRCSLSIL